MTRQKISHRNSYALLLLKRIDKRCQVPSVLSLSVFSTNSGSLLYISTKCNPLLVILKVRSLSSYFMNSFCKRKGKYSFDCLNVRNAFNSNFEFDKVPSFIIHSSMSAIISILLRFFFNLILFMCTLYAHKKWGFYP